MISSLLRYARMGLFHLREFSRVGYFTQLLLTTVISMVVIQELARFAWGGDPLHVFLRASVVGVWTSATSAAGILGFERAKGTLVFLLSGQVSPFAATSAVISAASTYGLLSFPLSYLTTCLCEWVLLPIPLAQWPVLLAEIVLLWIACLAMTHMIAAIFILTPNAIRYEGLLLVPVLAISGIFTGGVLTATRGWDFLSAIGWLIPVRGPVLAMFDAGATHPVPCLLLASMTCSLAWFIVSWWCGALALRRARRTATLEVY